MKTAVIHILLDQLAGAKDNLGRAEHTFGGLKLEETHGESGHTRQQILDRYVDEVDRLERCLKWVKGHNES